MSKSNKEKKKSKDKNNDKKYIVVDCISTFHMRYVVELDKDDPESYAHDDVVMGECKEFSQNHLDETIVTSREITNVKDVIKLARKDNAYLSSWDDDMLIDRLVTKKKAKETLGLKNQSFDQDAPEKNSMSQTKKKAPKSPKKNQK